MKFLLELVPCCGIKGADIVEATVLSPQETRSFVRLNSRRQRQRGRSRAAEEEWKPSLGVILEDVAATMIKRESSRKEAVKRKNSGGYRRTGGGGSRSVFYPSSYNDNFGQRGSLATMMGTFSPTPFIF